MNIFLATRQQRNDERRQRVFSFFPTVMCWVNTRHKKSPLSIAGSLNANCVGDYAVAFFAETAPTGLVTNDRTTATASIAAQMVYAMT